MIHSEIDEISRDADSFVEHNVKFCFTEWRCNLVLNHLCAHAISNIVLTIFDRANAANVDANGRIELERASTRRCFGTAEHHANLLAQLIDEDHDHFAFGNSTRQLSHRLTHQSSLQSNVTIAHFSFDFRTWNQRSNRINDDHINGIGSHKKFADFQSLFASIGL